jgi:hypothetical protein
VVLVKATGDGEHLECQLLQGNAPQAAAPAMAQSSAQQAAEPASWYVVVGRDKVGPLVPGQIAEYLAKGELTIHSLAWHKGMAGWVKIEELPELLHLLATSKAVGAARESGLIAAQPVHPAASAPSAGHGHAQAPQSQNPRASQGLAPQPMSPRASQGLAPQPQSPRASQGLAPQPVARPAAAPSAAQPAAPSAPQPAAQRPAQPAAAPSAAPQQPRPAPAPARPTSPQQAKPNDLDDAGPTMEASIPAQLRPAPPSKAQGKGEAGKAPAGKADAAKSEARTAKSPPQQLNTADVHGDAFFNSHHDLHDIELALPDPNKHKPTKEEYQNLIQEFSVMFRLDKRTKRQKVLIAVVLASLLIGAIAFGVILSVSAQRKKDLIRDSKELLAAFDLGYKASVVPDLSPEQKEEQEAAAKANPGQPLPTIKAAGPISMVGDKMLKAARRKAAKSAPGSQFAAAARPSSGDASKQAAELEKAEIARQAELQKRLAAAGAQYGVVGKQEAVIGGGMGGTQAVSSSEVKKLCRERAGDLAACAKAAGAEGGFTAKLTVNVMGGIDRVSATVSGSADSSLGSCIKSKLGRVNFGRQPSESTHTCEVN